MWARLKDIPPFIAAIVAIVASVIAGATAVVNYFVSYSHFERVTASIQQAVSEADCIAITKYALIDSQLQQKISADEVRNLKATVIALEKQNQPNVQVIIDEYKARIVALSQVRADARKKAAELLDRLTNDGCADGGHVT